MAEDITWTFNQRIYSEDNTVFHHSGELQIVLSETQTQISSSSALIFIDYEKMTLHRLDRSSGECSVFPVLTKKNTGDERVAAQIELLLAEFSVKELGEYKEVQGMRCVKKRVLSGAGMFRFKTAVSKVITRYGESFREKVAEYWFSTEFESWPDLQEIMLQRREAFAVAPLLKQIDPLGLMGAAESFPVQGWQKYGDTVVEQTLASGPVSGDFSLQFPRECRKE